MKRIAAIASALLLGACGEGSVVDREVLKAYRDNGIRACVAAAQASGAAGVPQALVTRLCTCTTERTMAGRSAADLATLVPGGPETRAAALACLREIAPQAAAAAGIGAGAAPDAA